MAGGAQKQGEAITGINVTPFVDVMLVLLIIFMVTANYINNQSIKVELPKAASGDTPDDNVNLGFVIDAYSNVYLDGQPLDLKELPAKIALLKQDGKNLQALIGADTKAKHGAVVSLIDALRNNGIYDFALNIEVQN